MNKRIFLSAAVAALAVLAVAPVRAADSHPSAKRPFNLPPQADLVYSIKARQRSISINGDATVQWRHSLRLPNHPYMARDETSPYSDLMPDGKARIFTYQMEAKSVVTFPSGAPATRRSTVWAFDDPATATSSASPAVALVRFVIC